MSANPVWMPLYVDDYAGATARLTCEQHGAYMQIIMDYWRNGPPPDDDDVLMQIVKLDRARWRKHRSILAKLFRIEDGEWRHKRIDRELAKSADISSKRQAAGRDGANKRWNGKSDSKDMANAMADPLANASQNDRQPQPQPQPQLEEEDSDPKVTLLPPAAFAFSGRVIRLTRRDFDQWQRTYHAIPDLNAELTALDDWLRENDDPKAGKRWFQIVSGALAKKHQRFLAEAKAASDGGLEFTGPC